jgi:hypothetical protein
MHSCYFQMMTVTPTHHIDSEHKKWMVEGICWMCGKRRVTLYESHLVGRNSWVTKSTEVYYNPDNVDRLPAVDMTGIEVYSGRGDMDLSGKPTQDQ